MSLRQFSNGNVHSLLSTTNGTQRRTVLKAAPRTYRGLHLWRYGQRSWPAYRRPFISTKKASDMIAHHHWQHYGPKYANRLLPSSNYICGPYTGAFYIMSDAVYTLQHATSGAPVRIKRYPGFFDFNHPSRWFIGKKLMSHVHLHPRIIDEVTISKKYRLTLVKRGWLPK